MARVSLDKSCRPTVDLTVVGPKGETALTTVIDTGFNGFLSIPSKYLQQVGLPKSGESRVTGSLTLADNRQVNVELCLGSARLDDDEQWGMCVIAPADGDALCGMTALLSFKKRLIVDIANDSVELDATAYVYEPLVKS